MCIFIFEVRRKNRILIVGRTRYISLDVLGETILPLGILKLIYPPVLPLDS